MPRAKRAPDEPRRDPNLPPPLLGEDPELDRVEAYIKGLDNSRDRFAAVLRDTFDQLYDGNRTGRFHPDELTKTERTHMGSLVEINLQREFGFRDGRATIPEAEALTHEEDAAIEEAIESCMDFEIEGVQVDCKFSKYLGGWMIPREAVRGKNGEGHVLLVVWADDQLSRWEAGLVRAAREFNGTKLLTSEKGNQDGKRSFTVNGQCRVRYLWDDRPALLENLLLHLQEDQRERIFNPTPHRGGDPSGQAKVNMLFRLVQKRLVNRASVETVAKQKDPMKRVRDARKPKHLGGEGILILGHQDEEDRAAAGLGLDVPKKGSFISARVVPAESGWTGDAAEINGSRWRLADDGDPIVPAPVMPKPSRKTQ
jgi:hypothetical protein